MADGASSCIGSAAAYREGRRSAGSHTRQVVGQLEGPRDSNWPHSAGSVPHRGLAAVVRSSPMRSFWVVDLPSRRLWGPRKPEDFAAPTNSMLMHRRLGASWVAEGEPAHADHPVPTRAGCYKARLSAVMIGPPAPAHPATRSHRANAIPGSDQFRSANLFTSCAAVYSKLHDDHAAGRAAVAILHSVNSATH